ncbi:MAG: STAS domain-containing protein [Solirubrobacteraceae bacterium]
MELAPDREQVTMHVVGEIDLATADEVEKPLLELFDEGFAHAVVDLHDVTFIDSSGIPVLITGHQHAENLGARLSILVGASRIRQTLELSGAIGYLAVS